MISDHTQCLITGIWSDFEPNTGIMPFLLVLCPYIMPLYYALILCPYIMPLYYALILCPYIMPLYYALILCPYIMPLYIMPLYYALILCPYIMPLYYALILCPYIMPFIMLHESRERRKLNSYDNVKLCMQFSCLRKKYHDSSYLKS